MQSSMPVSPTTLLQRPRGQLRQGVSENLYFPGMQLAQAISDAMPLLEVYLPGLQDVHAVLPPDAQVPALQYVQAVLPLVPVNVPAGQDMQSVAPSMLVQERTAQSRHIMLQ